MLALSLLFLLWVVLFSWVHQRDEKRGGQIYALKKQLLVNNELLLEAVELPKQNARISLLNSEKMDQLIELLRKEREDEMNAMEGER